MEGFHYLYHPVTRRLHHLLDSGELGELRAVEIDMFMPAPDDGDPRWSYEPAHLRDRAPLPTDADDAVANMQLIDDCYRAAGLTPRPAGQPLINEAAH